MHEIAFSIGVLKIHWYGICAACGFLAAMLALQWKRKYAGINKDNVMDIGMIAMFAGVLGSRIFYVIQFHDQFAGHWLDVVRIDKGGLVFYGGFILAFLVLVIYCRIKKINLARLLDIFGPALALGHALGRIGCFMQGCCFGKPVPEGFPFGVVFPAGSFPASRYPAVLDKAAESLPLYPVQLIEAGVNILLFLLLSKLVGKFKEPGKIGALYFMAYALMRFLLEYLRGDHTDFAFGLFTPSQTIALFVMFPLGLLAFLTAKYWSRWIAPQKDA